MRKLAILCMLVVLLMASGGCSDAVPQNKYDSLLEQYANDLAAVESETATLKDRYSELEAQIAEAQDDQASLEAQLTANATTYEQLQVSHDELSDAYDALQTEHETLSTDYSLLQALYDGLHEDYGTLQGGLDALSATYDSLEVSYDELSAVHEASETLRIGHLLADYYDEIRDGFWDSYGGYHWWPSAGPSWQEQVKFAANIARHGLARVYWPDYEPVYHDRAGEGSYATAHNALLRVLDVIGIEVSDSPAQEIEKILGFINTHIHYEYDFNETYLAPMETLGFRSGDCDDYAILAAALFEEVGIDAAIGFFTDGSGGHAMVLVHLDQISPYPCHYYEDLTGFGLQPETWLIIEPQTTIDNQLTDWVDQWDLFAAAEV